MKKTITISSVAIVLLLIGGVSYFSKQKVETNDINRGKILKDDTSKFSNILTENDDSSQKLIIENEDNISSDKNISLKDTDSIKDYVVNIGVPSKERKQKINVASRYGELGFEFTITEMLTSISEEKMSDEKLRKLLENAYELAYHGEIILSDYVNGKLSYKDYLRAINESFIISMEKNRKILSSDEFQKMYRDDQNIKEFDIELVMKNRFFTSFPNLNKEKYNIESLNDLESYFSEEEITKIIDIAENRTREEIKIAIKAENVENYNYNVEDAKMKKIEQDYSNSMKKFLTEEQLDILEGGNNSKKREKGLDYNDEEEDLISEDDINGLTDEQKEALKIGEVISIPVE